VSRHATFVPLRTEEPASVLAVLGPVELVSSSEVKLSEFSQSSELHQRLQELAQKMRRRYSLNQIVGNSPAIRRVRQQIESALVCRAHVLVVGPQGSGREQIARTIHYASVPHDERRLIPLDCSAMDMELLKSTLESLVRSDKGQRLSETTLLLLHLDELPEEAQAEFALFVRSSTFGARILATARRSLTEFAAQGKFHRDLAYEVSTLVLELPALRDRREDIPELAQRMVEEHNAEGGRQLAGFSPSALDRLASLPWTGNVKELSAVVREACQNVTTVWIGDADLPVRVRQIMAAGLHPRRAPEEIQLDAFLVEVERELIERAMRRAKNNKAQAARLLGISRARMLRRLEQLGLIDREVVAAIEFHPEEDEEPETDEDIRTAGGL
jgi:DNA-binding NtrC family response regulator